MRFAHGSTHGLPRAYRLRACCVRRRAGAGGGTVAMRVGSAAAQAKYVDSAVIGR
jgi:hypothetical protein